jgi:hypothetical protein
MDSSITLNCLAVDGEGNTLGGVFRVPIPCRGFVSNLQKAIKVEKPHQIGDFDSDELLLWKLSTPLQAVHGDKTAVKELLENFNRDAESVAESMNPLLEVCDYFKEEPARKSLHLIVQISADNERATKRVKLEDSGKPSFLLELTPQVLMTTCCREAMV